ncbi:MAG: serine/threonine protein kinase [Dehalococcoidia bacterium]
MAIARPPLPPQEPLASLVPGEVPERKRYCSNCGAKLTREVGFCPKCGQEYSFKPSLMPGDLVAGKYEIKGTLAFGGLGWIYLALDTVLSRWVVLKGLLNSKDPNMVALPVKEREFPSPPSSITRLSASTTSLRRGSKASS